MHTHTRCTMDTQKMMAMWWLCEYFGELSTPPIGRITDIDKMGRIAGRVLIARRADNGKTRTGRYDSYRFIAEYLITMGIYWSMNCNQRVLYTCLYSHECWQTLNWLKRTPYLRRTMETDQFIRLIRPRHVCYYSSHRCLTSQREDRKSYQTANETVDLVNMFNGEF